MWSKPMIATQTISNPTSRQITDGMTVYGSGGDKVGTVRNYDPQASYLDIQKSPLFTKDFYLGWGTIAKVTADGVTLRLSNKELHNRLFAAPPPGTIAYNAGLVVIEHE
jgi:hypothetical protein